MHPDRKGRPSAVALPAERNWRRSMMISHALAGETRAAATGRKPVRRSSGYACRLILLEQVVERRPADPEQLGGARDIVLGAGQRLADRPAVGDFARGAEVDRQRAGLAAAAAQVEVGGADAICRRP